MFDAPPAVRLSITLCTCRRCGRPSTEGRDPRPVEIGAPRVCLDASPFGAVPSGLHHLAAGQVGRPEAEGAVRHHRVVTGGQQRQIGQITTGC